MLRRKRKLSLRKKRTSYKIRMRMVMTSPVFTHANSIALHKLKVLQNKLCISATDAYRYVGNSILDKVVELPTISKYIKDSSERFFSIAKSHPNPLHSTAPSYEAPPSNYFIHRTQ
ncbi:hypothetical protein EVAR_63890_1 [Eumeta japonica]|uniref:Uncharacterized protein n=1 Tax=Eumeta variegata TaxID=151549 RepID=A0A4C1ZM81_EUMVA|nr:hypothetical protein EVAR_63890_1 [Eumeta japonica]